MKLRNDLTSEQLDFVEQMGMVAEQDGRSRMAGRIAGFLLICDPPEQTAGSIREALGVSTGAVSTALRELRVRTLVEEVPKAGTRARYFRIRPGAWTDGTRRAVEGIRKLVKIAEAGMPLVEGDDRESTRRLKEMRDYYRFMAEALPELLDRWERNRGRE